MRQAACVLILVLAASTADAQSTYVGASFIGDVIRASGPTGGTGPFGSGEAFGGALRVGTPLGGSWGVEAELARTGEIDAMPDVAIQGQGSTGRFDFRAIGIDDPILFPIPQISSTSQLSTFSTLLWWHHELGPRASLVYLGGVAFTRTELDMRVSYPNLIFPPIPIGGVGRAQRTIESETVVYDADVVVGFEGRIGMTEHLRLVPGVRLHTAGGGWAIRPGIGVQWMF